MSWFSGSAPVGGGPPSHARERVPGQIEPLQLPGPKFRPVPSALGLAGCGTDFVGTLTRSWRLVMLHPFRGGRVCLVFPVRVPCDLPLTQGPSWRPCAAHSEGPVPRPGATRHAGALRNQPDGRSHSGPPCPAALYQPVKVRSPRLIGEGFGTLRLLGQCPTNVNKSADLAPDHAIACPAGPRLLTPTPGPRWLSCR